MALERQLKTAPAATSPSDEVVRLVSLTKAFGKKVILNNISLKVRQGEFLSIVGPSGCGKTTLLKILDGLELPSNGFVEINGATVNGPNPDCAVVFQDASLLPWKTAKDNIAFGLELRHINPTPGYLTDLLDLVGLRGCDDLFPRQLSGGMRQRVNLARALAVDPAVLLMDEPFASLDAYTRELMQLELLRIWSAKQKTVIFITHQLDEAVYLSDRVVAMGARPGRIIDELTIPFERPRDISIKRGAEMGAYVDHLWRAIQAKSE